MFEAMFVGASLFEAAVWFLGGLLLGEIGLAVFIDSNLFRRRAERRRARILGVIGKKQSKGGQAVYWPVYEHMGGDGELIRARASTSGRLAGNLPGTFRDVLVKSEDPYGVRSLTLLTREDHLATLRKLDSSRREWLPFVTLLGLGIFAFGIWRGRDLVTLQSIAIVDRGLWNWAIPGGCGFFGALILAASVQGLAGAHRRRAEEMGPRGGEMLRLGAASGFRASTKWTKRRAWEMHPRSSCWTKKANSRASRSS